jgi:hypothetical protein
MATAVFIRRDTQWQGVSTKPINPMISKLQIVTDIFILRHRGIKTPHDFSDFISWKSESSHNRFKLSKCISTMSLSLLALAAAPYLSHGIVISPPTRAVGPASQAACGKDITSIIKSDNQSGIEVLHQASVSDKGYNPAKCNLLVCKGLQLEDNLHNVQSYLPGQEVEIKVRTRIPHKGWVNLAIVCPRTLMLIGSRWRVLRRIR